MVDFHPACCYQFPTGIFAAKSGCHGIQLIQRHLVRITGLAGDKGHSVALQAQYINFIVHNKAVVCGIDTPVQVGADFALAGGELLFTFGSSADGIATGAILHGTLNENVFRNSDVKNPALSGEMLIHNLKAGDVLLVKASRGAMAERVIEYIKANKERIGG